MGSGGQEHCAEDKLETFSFLNLQKLQNVLSIIFVHGLKITSDFSFKARLGLHDSVIYVRSLIFYQARHNLQKGLW